MAKGIVMPKAGITVESCIIGKWKKKVGDTVAVGDILFDYETDKASFECEATEAGTLLEIFFNDGEEVPVLVNVCAVGNAGEDVSALRPGDASPAPAPAPAEAPKEQPKQEEAKPIATPAPTALPASDSTRISPRARGLAERAGVNPADATGTGPKGRIVEADVRRLMAEGPAEKVAQAPVVCDEGEFEEIKFSGIRRAISKSMKTSLSTGAQLTNNHSFDATGIQRARAEFKAAGGDLAGITIGDMVLFAVSRTLLSHPDLNAIMPDDNSIRRYKSVNLGVAVDTPRGLMVPVIFGADKKSILEISKEVKQLAEEARSGSISPDKLKGGSFTVSNLGAFGVESFTPVINPPQTGILGVCNIQYKPRQKGDGFEFYPAMGLSLTYDHRAVDGGPAAKFAKDLCHNLENFTALLLK